MHNYKYIAALTFLPSLTPRRLAKVMDYYPTAQDAWNADTKELTISAGLHDANIINEEKKLIDPDKLEEEIIKHNIKVILAKDNNYPLLLKFISIPPPVIFVQGNVPDSSAPFVSIVGTRKCTAYGREAAFKLAEGLADAGVTIVSGMARGIDTSAHRGCMKQGGKTIAVLGCGLDCCYPPENFNLKKEIALSGAVISEFPPGIKPIKTNFPRRNRLISGLSPITIIVEAPLRSGALITADFALEQGREVMAMPGSIFSPVSKGCHRLIKDGAALMQGIEDVLELLELKQGNNDEIKTALTFEETAIFNILEYEPESIDHISRKSGIPVSKTMPLLTQMAMKGIIASDGFNRYFRTK